MWFCASRAGSILGFCLLTCTFIFNQQRFRADRVLMPALQQALLVGGNYLDTYFLTTNRLKVFDKLRQKNTVNELEKAKKKLAEAIDNDINSSQKSIDDLCKILTDFKKYKYSKHDSFFNLCIFSDIISIDLTILLEKVRLANRDQERKLYARVIALTIVDYLDNISVLIGRDCLTELKNNNMTEFLDEFKSVHKKFSVFKKNNERVLREIRNNTIAHKAKDALKLNAYINNLSVDDISNFGLELKIYTTQFIDLSTKIIHYIADYMEVGRKI